MSHLRRRGHALACVCVRSGDAAGFASGGFMGNSRVSGQILSGSQQQWLTRNVEVQGGFPQVRRSHAHIYVLPLQKSKESEGGAMIPHRNPPLPFFGVFLLML
jgi:hypothetical protein